MGQMLNALGVPKKVYKNIGGDKGFFLGVVTLELALKIWAGVLIG